MIRYIASICVLVFGIIYWPINLFFLWVQKWYLKMKVEDKVIFWLFTPFYWLLVVIVTLISLPYEAIANLAGH